MKGHSFLVCAGFAMLSVSAQTVRAQPNALGLIYETPSEFLGRGDFNGDGRVDIVLVDKASGKYRLGYQVSGGSISWVDCRISGLRGITGCSIGQLVATNRDALVLAAANANQVTLVEASDPSAPDRPLAVPFTSGLGPQTVVAIDIGGTGKSTRADLYVASVFNSPEANLASWLRNDGSNFPELAQSVLPGPVRRANRLALKGGQPELLCCLMAGGQGDTFHVESAQSGKPIPVLTLAGLPAGSDYAVGNFRGSPLCEFLFYQPGQNGLTVRPVEEAVGGAFQLEPGARFDVGQAVRRLVMLTMSDGPKLLVIYGEGEQAGVFTFDGAKAPVPVQTLIATNELFTTAASLSDGFVMFSQPLGGKFSTRYQVYSASGAGFGRAAFGSLPSLADNDNIVIPDIRARIVANLSVTREADMKPTTNTIPGTRVTYVMVPIPGGEFLMGSPETESHRKPDEGPQHKVKISPFWMGQCEVTWNEYELFMYPDMERRTRALNQTDSAADKLADAVTHPSQPYVEMTFGMGKEGYPAIAMTQHAANKYCQWLSAKTGEFYRLPTEAEWEYACRAGTTTAYFFGDDPAKLKDYAWFEDTSDFKYQKVGKKKPNPWGLYDLYGNVVEYVLDQYGPQYYQQCAGADGAVIDPWNKATQPYPHSVRGGSWDDMAEMCRSAARRGSTRAWKATDPQLPKSIWYFSDAQWVGFRIVRPLKVPPAEEMQKYWTSGVERD
jgi:formylglycine-generating enzyme required for sulfatase activity